MTRSKPAHLRRFRLAALAITVGLLAGAALTATPQSRATSALASWIDRYYADYTAMSLAPRGPAMDAWLAHYAPYAFFEDPTAGLSGMGREQIRKPYLDAFTGTLGPVRWTILRRVTGGDWAAVEGWLDSTHTGQRVRTRFTTWVKIRDGQIVHQIDYLDYATIKRQVAGEETTSSQGDTPPTAAPAPARAGHALRLVEEFYRRYEAMPALASAVGVTRYVELLADDFRLEDPTGRVTFGSRQKLHAFLQDAVAKGHYGPLHWEIDRSLTDGTWVALEGTWRGVYKGRPFATRFATWLEVRGPKIARQIDYVDYATFRRLTSEPATSKERVR